MDKIRCALIGLGFFGEKHSEEIAERFGVAKTYTNYKDLLADDHIDVVNIVTHFQDHRDIAVDSLKTGKHVFLEKPMASTVAECN